MKRAAGRRNRYQSKKRYRHFQERISILVLFTTLEKKKKQATDKPYCLLHNNVIRKFSCLFYFSASPTKTTSLSLTVANLPKLSCRIVFLIRVSKGHNSFPTSFFLLNELLLKRAAGSWQEGETDRKQISM